MANLNDIISMVRTHAIECSQFVSQRNYFSWENMNEMADIDSHVKFASSLLGKYQWQSSVKQNLERQLNAIQEKQKDHKLNISVIGEFSTGKSSFVNALVGYELLAVNVIQGTTVAITIIEYDNEFAITSFDFSGRQKREVFPSIDALRKQLYIYTTDPIYAKQINYITVTLPSEILKSGFRIIDTPGTNSLELWHEDVTRRAINELSDLSIIITDATQPMPATMIAFVDNTLEDRVKECAFVANKIDRIKVTERDGIIGFIKNKICHSFELEDCFVFPFSSMALTNSFAREKVDVDAESALMTANSLKQLLTYTAKQRIKAQARKILHLIDNIYSTLDESIRDISNRYQKELQLLEYSRQTDLKPFLMEEIAIRKKEFQNEAKKYRYKIENAGDTHIAKAIEHINLRISSCSDGALDELSNYIKGSLTADIQEEGTKISKSLDAKFTDLLLFFNREITNFQTAFESEFKKLKILTIKLDVKTKNVSVRHVAHSANVASVTSFVSEELSKENWAMGGGAAAGAAIGTAICPGIGTAVGFFAGLFAGSFVAPDTPQIKKDVKQKLSVPLHSYFKTVVNDCMMDYDNYVCDLSSALEAEIRKYYSTYSSTIDQRIQQWNTQHRAIEDRIQQIEIEIANIKNRRSSIKNLLLKV